MLKSPLTTVLKQEMMIKILHYIDEPDRNHPVWPGLCYWWEYWNTLYHDAKNFAYGSTTTRPTAAALCLHSFLLWTRKDWSPEDPSNRGPWNQRPDRMNLKLNENKSHGLNRCFNSNALQKPPEIWANILTRVLVYYYGICSHFEK